MRFSTRKLDRVEWSLGRLSLALTLLFSVSLGASTQLPGARLGPEALYTNTPLSELLRLEYDRPDDPALKGEIARQYWCQGDRGLAVEHWKWLAQRSHAPLGPWNWKEILLWAQKQRSRPRLEALLVCPKPSQTQESLSSGLSSKRK